MCGRNFFSEFFPFLVSPTQRHQKRKRYGMEEEQETLAEHRPLEQEDLNFDKWKRKPVPQRTLYQNIAAVKKYLWNEETKEFMGRSGKSWSKSVCVCAARVCVRVCAHV